MPTERIPKTLHRSKFGTEYPSLPPAVVKKLASTYSRACGGNGRLNKETVLALSQASDWFFEQISDDLATYSTHARRKTIEEADVITLMKR
jgi:histone H3/H4